MKRNSPLSYKVDTGSRVINSVHIQLLKQYVQRDEALLVKRATTVLEPDADSDSVDQQYAEVVLSGKVEYPNRERDIQEWLDEFKTTMTEEPGLTNLTEFPIDTGDSLPISQRPYNTPLALRDSVDIELDWLIEKGYIRKSTSQWASPIVTVRKPDGSARICVDFKQINAVTTPLPFYMLRIEEVLEQVWRSKVISKLDFSKSYYQVPMVVADIPKTCFTCYRGKYEFVHMPFGVRNVPAVFQTLMTDILGECKGYASPYMDDVTIYSSSWEEHKQHVRNVLECLQKSGLTANPQKCCWGGKAMDFLGHRVGDGTMTIPDKRVEALRKYTKLTTKKGFRSFLGSSEFLQEVCPAPR